MMIKKTIFIEIYQKIGDKFIWRIDISKYDIKVINKICPPEDPFDLEYCDGAFIEEAQFYELKKLIKELSEISYSDFDFNIITRSIK